MLLNLENLNLKYDLKIKGVLHIGAHVGQELGTYQKLGISNVMFFEPVQETFNRLKKNVGESAIIINTALGNIEGEVEMYTETINEGIILFIEVEVESGETLFKFRKDLDSY